MDIVLNACVIAGPRHGDVGRACRWLSATIGINTPIRSRVAFSGGAKHDAVSAAGPLSARTCSSPAVGGDLRGAAAAILIRAGKWSNGILPEIKHHVEIACDREVLR